MTLKEQTTELISKISSGLLEREETVALTLLAVLSGQSVFLYGPPGTAKSLIARRISLAFKDSKYFEYLMNRFSTPEEVFGPVSIKELKEDRYVRKPKGYLPEADIAFLDEIWKSSPAILNTLLTIINERKFRNGDQVLDVPLKGIIAASNEIPQKNQGLEALYDRFIMRLSVLPMAERNHFESLLNEEPANAIIPIEESLKFNSEKWKDSLNMINLVNISKESLNIIHSIRVKIDEWNKNQSDVSKTIYISDRRWQKMSRILKMAAWLCDRDVVKPVDILILKNCLWTEIENKDTLSKIVEDSVREFCLFDFEKFDMWTDDLKNLKQDIEKTFFYDSDIYEGVEKIEGNEYFKVELNVPYLKRINWDYATSTSKIEVYLPTNQLKKNGDFYALNSSNEEFDSYKDPSNSVRSSTKITCNFNGTTTCTISYLYKKSEDYYNNNEQTKTQQIRIQPTYKKGDCKKVTHRIKTMYKNLIEELLNKHDKLSTEINQFYATAKQENETPFVNERDQMIVTEAIVEFQKMMNMEKLNAEQLRDKLDKHID